MKKMTDPEILNEKFYHSMASLLVDDGNLEDAIIYYQKAIDIGDTPYAWWGLARALRISEDIAGAVGAISRAIKLAPGIPEYHHERACLLDALGRPDLAEEDRSTAISLDPNYERIDIIRSAARVLHDIFRGPGDLVQKQGVHARPGALDEILKELEDEQRKLRDAFDRPSCPVTSCPAYCCHFKGKLFLHGVTIGVWKLKCLRDHFHEKGIEEDEFLDVFSLDQVQNAARLFPPQDIINRNNVDSVMYPRQADTRLEKKNVADVPKTEDYSSLMWTGDQARPCVFFTGGKCGIYGIGDDPSLDSCASFLCMTGFIFVALKYLGIIPEKKMAGKSMADLNTIAIESLIILAQDVYGNEEAASAKNELFVRLGEAGHEEYPSPEFIKECQDLKTGYDTIMARLTEAAGRKISRFF
ncbi:MAG: tetratricopeptide repeat protein [Syntrophorhabdaceae bacterium]